MNAEACRAVRALPRFARRQDRFAPMYDKLKSLDGRHPWRDVSPDGYVDYRVRPRPGGRVVYFNYALARELEMIPANHADRMDARLEKALLETFALQIINEYDLAHRKVLLKDARPHPYMATRYLQSQ